MRRVFSEPSHILLIETIRRKSSLCSKSPSRLVKFWEAAMSRAVAKEMFQDESIDAIVRDIQYGLEQAPQCSLAITIASPHFGLMEFRVLQLSKKYMSIQLSHCRCDSAVFVYEQRLKLSTMLSHQMNSNVRIDVCEYLVQRSVCGN